MSKIKVGMVTTINTNIGDDLIRSGIIKVFNKYFKKNKIEYILVNKHDPYSIYPSYHPINLSHLAKYLPYKSIAIENRIRNSGEFIGGSFFHSADIIVQCGAPVFWPNCNDCEWAIPIWKDVIGSLYEKTTVLNLAAGSCYPWETKGNLSHSKKDEEYIKQIIRYCKVTTVRDRLSQEICNQYGGEVRKIGCTAFLAPEHDSLSDEDKEYVVINYMEGGGHYDWGQDIDKNKWEETIIKLIIKLKKRHNLVFLCHDELEWDLAGKLDPDILRIWPKNVDEYFTVLPKISAAVCNRLHASVALAGAGVPTISIGTDTRLLMPEELGLSNFYVKEIDDVMLEGLLEEMISSKRSTKENLFEQKNKIEKEYLEILEMSFDSHV